MYQLSVCFLTDWLPSGSTMSKFKGKVRCSHSPDCDLANEYCLCKYYISHLVDRHLNEYISVALQSHLVAVCRVHPPNELMITAKCISNDVLLQPWCALQGLLDHGFQMYLPILIISEFRYISQFTQSRPAAVAHNFLDYCLQEQFLIS